MDRLNGRMLAYQIILGALIARLANQADDPVKFLSELRDDAKGVIAGVRINGLDDPDGVRQAGLAAADELFGLMKAPSEKD